MHFLPVFQRNYDYRLKFAYSSGIYIMKDAVPKLTFAKRIRKQ